MLVTAEDLESIEATLELLADTHAQERIRRSEADFARVMSSTSAMCEL